MTVRPRITPRGGTVADAGHARRGARPEDQPGYTPGVVLSVSRTGGQPYGGFGRRPHAGGGSRRAELSGVPPEARAADARLLRHLPSAAIQLRHRRGEDGHDIRQYGERPQYPYREMPGLPSEGDSQEEGRAGGAPHTGIMRQWRGGPNMARQCAAARSEIAEWP